MLTEWHGKTEKNVFSLRARMPGDITVTTGWEAMRSMILFLRVGDNWSRSQSE